jgi:hypothetical protein
MLQAEEQTTLRQPEVLVLEVVYKMLAHSRFSVHGANAGALADLHSQLWWAGGHRARLKVPFLNCMWSH